MLAIDAAKTTWTPASVTIVFTEKVDAAEANDKANYTLTQGDGRTGASITKAVLQDDGVTVILTVAGTALSIDTAADREQNEYCQRADCCQRDDQKRDHSGC